MLRFDHQDPMDWEPMPLELPLYEDRSRPNAPVDGEDAPEPEPVAGVVIVIDLA